MMDEGTSRRLVGSRSLSEHDQASRAREPTLSPDIQRLHPVTLTGVAGSAPSQLDLAMPPLASGPFGLTPGSTWNFQFWFRDPLAGQQGFNLLDGLEVTLCPQVGPVGLLIHAENWRTQGDRTGSLLDRVSLELPHLSIPRSPQSPDWGGLTWSSWIPLDAPLRLFQSTVPQAPGFYRVRAPGHAGLIYVGQTGRKLRERTRALSRGVYRARADSPWNDPHTASPGMWAFRWEDDYEYELSVATVEQDPQTRHCFEDFLLHQHRIHCGTSTLLNHGRHHPCWSRPSNKARGVAAERLARPTNYPSLPLAFGSEPLASRSWLGLDWSEETAFGGEQLKAVPGVYRIRLDDEFVYFGQSKNLRARLQTHSHDPRFLGGVLSTHSMPDALPHHLLERETDLIGAHLSLTGKPPRCQYGGV